MICIAGKNNIAVSSLKYILNEMKIDKNKIIVLPNKNDSYVDGWQLSLAKFAKDSGIRICNLNDLYNIEDLVLISLEYDRIINTRYFKSKCLYNIHFSLLPKYKGMYTSAHVLLNGEKETGVTLHRIDDGVDTGDIIDQLKFSIDINDTCRDVYFKYLDYGYLIFKKNIKSILENNFISMPQSNINSTYYSKNSIDYNNLNIDFNKTSFEIHNQIRAYIFEEFQLPEINGRKIYKSVLTNRKSLKANEIIEQPLFFEISGIDRYIVEAYKKQK